MRRSLLIAAMVMMVLALVPAASASQRKLDLISDPQGANGAFDADFVAPKGGNASFFYGIRDGGNWWEVPVSDGTHALYSTNERLVPADIDYSNDLYDYAWSHGLELVTERSLSIRPPFGAFCSSLHQYGGAYGGCPVNASVDGRHVFFTSIEKLVPEDIDDYVDLYERFNGVLKLVSKGPTGGNGPYDVCSEYVSPCRAFYISLDGERVFFETREALVPEDTDNGCTLHKDVQCVDIYERSNGTTKLVSTGPNDRHGADDVCAGQFCTFRQPFPVSVDGSHVFFLTDAQLVSEDHDGSRDLYDRSNGTTTLLSTGSSGGDGNFDIEWSGASAHGERAFFTTRELLVPEDSNGDFDAYEHSGGVTKLVARGTAENPFGGPGLIFKGPSYDGSRIFFSTKGRLVSADTDDSFDLYARTGDKLELISTGPAGGNGPFDVCGTGGYGGSCIEGASRDGSRVYFTTKEALVSEDTDNQCEVYVGQPAPCPDIYEHSDGVTKLVSTGPIGDGAGVAFDSVHSDGVSADGSRIFFSTKDRLVPEDDDGDKQDIYERHGNETTLISAGPEGPGYFNVFPTFGGMSADGRVVYFSTGNPLLPEDTDRCFTSGIARGCVDVYASRIEPDCTKVTASPLSLAPANHKFRRIVLSDRGAASLDIAITGVTQDEPVTSKGDPTKPDARSAAASQKVDLRAERSPRGDGRVYVISFEGTDRFGGACTGSVSVSVPRHPKAAAIDSAPPSFDSFRP